MIPDEIKTQMVTFIEEETKRIQYGRLLIEVTVHNGKCTNIQAETKRSLGLNICEVAGQNEKPRRPQTGVYRA